MTRPLRAGDRVIYGREFLRAIRASPVDRLWTCLGEVLAIRKVGPCTLVTVRWADGPTYLVAACNLARVHETIT